MSKYKPLWNYLNKNKKDTYKLTYEEIKKEVLKIKQKVFDKQQEINLEKIKGDF